jgi:hypothetical protein
MDRSKVLIRWILLHLFLFLITPFFFILTGLLVGGLMTVLSPSLGSSSPTGSLLAPPYQFALSVLAPLLTGAFLGAAAGTLQIFSIQKLVPRLKTFRWISACGLGMALAFLAIAWGYNDLSLPNPLPLAAVFGGAVYGLIGGIPQSRMLKKHMANTWGWILASSIAGGFSFILAIAPVWLADGNLFFWLFFPLCAVAGILYGLGTGVWIYLFAQFSQLSSLVPGSVQEKSI